MADIVWIREDVLCEAAIDRIAGVLLRVAQGFPARETVPAMPAGRMQPRHADAVSFLHRGHASADRGDGADTFMTRDEGRVGLHRPVTVRRVQVRVADARGFDLYQDLALTNLRHRHLIDRQRLLELVDHRRFHHFRHRRSRPRMLVQVTFPGQPASNSAPFQCGRQARSDPKRRGSRAVTAHRRFMASGGHFPIRQETRRCCFGLFRWPVRSNQAGWIRPPPARIAAVGAPARFARLQGCASPVVSVCS